MFNNPPPTPPKTTGNKKAMQKRKALLDPLGDASSSGQVKRWGYVDTMPG